MKNPLIKMAKEIRVEVDFFSQIVEAVIYEFSDSYLVIGTHVVPSPTRTASSLNEAKEFARTIYYDN